MTPTYNEDSIRTLSWREHIRNRPGMYIGKLGDGSCHDDGIYILLKEVVDNSIDEFVMGNGKTANRIDITIVDNIVTVRDYGRGIPLSKIVDCVSKINTGAKYDSEAFKKSVGLNGVGLKAVNALSSYFVVRSTREGLTASAEFSQGNIVREDPSHSSTAPCGTEVSFTPDGEIFTGFTFKEEYVENLFWNYAYLNTGLTIHYNDKAFHSEKGLFDLLNKNLTGDILYPIIHSVGKDIEIAFTHGSQYGEEYYSFVNGQHTTQGGTHQNSFREAIVKTLRQFFKKDYDAQDIRASIIAAVSIKVQEPVFESQTKTKLGSQHIVSGGESVRNFICNFIDKELDNFLHRNPDVAEKILSKILQSERERNELVGIRQLARERAKKANVCNKKLRDCRVHFNTTHDDRQTSTLFITEGDSASGSITIARDVNTQAVFSLKGKPLNVFGITKQIVYENEEFNLLQHALSIEDGLDGLRYNNVVLATDADVDGMHIRLLLITFFIQFFPDLVKNNHLYILQTPLFRVRNKKETIYCYNENERVKAIAKLGPKPEITRFKGLGEISPDEFKHFIGPKIRLEPVLLSPENNAQNLLSYYMGKNTQERQEFIIQNLRHSSAAQERL